MTLAEYLDEASAIQGIITDRAQMRELGKLLAQVSISIPHERLVYFGVLSPRNLSCNTKITLHQLGLVEGKDFRCVDVLVPHTSGRKHAKAYYLHPDAFELALIRSRNTKEFAKYYIALRRCVEGYKEYQALLRERTLTGELEVLRAERKKDALELARLRAEAPPPRHMTFLHRREEPAPNLGCLYFIELPGSGLFKIGYTRRLAVRLKALQATSPHELAVYRSIHCIGPATYEALAHRHFGAARRRGEWFAVTRAEIDGFVAELEL